MSLEKRADDVDTQSLMTLVQRQASKIAAMEAGLTSLQTSDQQQSSAISELNTKMNDVTARLNNPGRFKYTVGKDGWWRCWFSDCESLIHVDFVSFSERKRKVIPCNAISVG